MQMYKFFVLYGFLSLVILFNANSTFAADFNVSTAVTDTQTASDGTGTITSDGSITVTTTSDLATGVISSNSQISNAGTISAISEGPVEGISSNHDTITNTGTISASSSSTADSIVAVGISDNNGPSSLGSTIINSGTISATRTNISSGDGGSNAINIQNDANPLTITNTGTINSTSSNYAWGIGVNSNNTIDNQGTISVTTSGNVDAWAIVADTDEFPQDAGTGGGNDNVITNSGTIEVTSSTSQAGMTGILAQGTNNSVTNSGTITATAANGEVTAIYINPPVNGDADVTEGGSVSNTGTINLSSGGDGISYGIHSTNTGSSGDVARSITLNNSGRILFSGSNNANGIATQSDSTVTNNGTISITNTGTAYANGIYGQGDSNNISNTGTISVSSGGTQVGGIVTSGNSNIITNKGTIIANTSGNSGDRIAIGFTDIDNSATSTTSNTLNYYTHGVVAGRIIFGSTDSNNFNILDGAKDREHLISYEGTANVSVAGNLLSAHNSSTKKIAIFNKSQHVRANEMTSEISNMVQNVTQEKLEDIQETGCRAQLRGRGKRGMCNFCSCGRAIKYHNLNSWVEIIGSYQQQPKNSSKSLVASDMKAGGIIAGQNNVFSVMDMSVGAYIGGVTGKQNISDSNISSKGTGVVLGLYGAKKLEDDLHLSWILGGGYLYKDRDRKIYNNLTSNGSETINGTSHNFFIAPGADLTYIHRIDNDWSVIPSLSVNFVNERIGELAENTGTGGAKQTVKSRNIGTINNRIQLSVKKYMGFRKNNYFSLYGGIKHRKLLYGKKVNIVAVGQSNKFDVKGSDQYQAFLGLRFSRRVNKSAHLFLTCEAGKGLNKSAFKNNYGGSVQLGANINF